MQQLKNTFRLYRKTLAFPMAIVLGWDLQKVRKWEYVPAIKEISTDLCLTLIWPLTGPTAVKKAYQSLEFGPFLDD